MRLCLRCLQQRQSRQVMFLALDMPLPTTYPSDIICKIRIKSLYDNNFQK
nr:MAG TPA: hypothetical protein [Caudoviricetes sp.]